MDLTYQRCLTFMRPTLLKLRCKSLTKLSEASLLGPKVLFLAPCSITSDSATPWTVIHQAPPSMEFSRQEYWSGLSFPSPGDLPDPGIEPRSPMLQADALPSEPPGKPQETGKMIWYSHLFRNLPQFVVIYSQRLSHSQ